MMLIGCDFHPSWQQVSWLDVETGETGEQKLVHARGEAKQFYEQLAAPVLIGMEATGNSQWFIELVVKRHLVCKRWTIEKADENSNGIPWFVLHRPNSDKLRFHLPSLPWHWFDA